MGKFNAATELDNYASSGSFFSLADDGDSAVLHFMYNSVDDIDGYAVHRVKVNGYEVDVNCLRDYSDPLDKCPLCNARYRVRPKFFINLYDEESGEVKVWTRGEKFYPQMKEELGLLKPLVSYPVQIVRHGEKGDQYTKYELIPQDPIDLILDDVPNVEDPIGTFIQDRTFEELTTYVRTGAFDTNPSNGGNGNNGNNTEVRRRRDVSSSPASRRNTSDDVPL